MRTTIALCVLMMFCVSCADEAERQEQARWVEEQEHHLDDETRHIYLSCVGTVVAGRIDNVPEAKFHCMRDISLGLPAEGYH